MSQELKRTMMRDLIRGAEAPRFTHRSAMRN
jgi:hypothetical protein